MVGQTAFLKSGFDFVNTVMNRGYAFESDVLTRVRRSVDPKDLSFVGTSLIQPLSDTSGGATTDTSPPAIRLAAKQGTSHTVSLQLQNHLLAPEKIALTATPFSTPEGRQHITG